MFLLLIAIIKRFQTTENIIVIDDTPYASCDFFVVARIFFIFACLRSIVYCKLWFFSKIFGSLWIISYICLVNTSEMAASADIDG